MSIGILYHVFIVQIQSWGRFEFVFEKGSEILSENSWKLYFDFLNPSFATDQWVSWISPAPSSPRDTRQHPARLSLDLSPPPLLPHSSLFSSPPGSPFSSSSPATPPLAVATPAAGTGGIRQPSVRIDVHASGSDMHASWTAP